MPKTPFPRIPERSLQSTAHHASDLKALNGKLAELVESLRKDQRQHLSRSGLVVAPGRDAVRPEAVGAEAVGAEAAQPAEPSAAELQAELQRLRERLGEIEAENRRICDEFVAVQEQNAELVALYAAIERLHEVSSRSAVLGAIQEIVVNLVGSEHFALYEKTADGRRLVVARALGVDAAGLGEVAIGSGVVGRVAAEGKAFVAPTGGAGAAPEVLACVPLKVAGAVTGALAIHRLLGHKPSLSAFDHELFALLERHAGLALASTAGRTAD